MIKNEEEYQIAVSEMVELFNTKRKSEDEKNRLYKLIKETRMFEEKQTSIVKQE